MDKNTNTVDKFTLLLQKSEELGYKTEIISEDKQIVKLSEGDKERFIIGPLMPLNTTVSAKISKDKNITKQILSQKNIRTPQGIVSNNWENVDQAIDSGEIKFPIVIKPNDAALGTAVSVDINSKEDAKKAFDWVQEKHESVLIEEFLPWNDHRFFVVDGKCVAAAQRVQPYVTGDGISTLQRLIDDVNKTKTEKEVRIDDEAIRFLRQQGYTLEDVIDSGEKVIIRGNANIQTGGFIVDITDTTAKKFVEIAEQCAQIIGLRLAGVDILSPDITNSESEYAVTELNALPSYPYIHDHPDVGVPREPIKDVLEAVFR